MRCIDDNQPGLRPDRRLDRIEIKVEFRAFQSDLAWHQVCGQQHRLIAEPGRLGKHDLIAAVENQMQCHHDRREGPRGQRNVSGFEGKSQFAADTFCQKRLRFLLTRLVREPVFVSRHRTLADCGDEASKRHFMRIAEGKIANIGVVTMPRVA